MSFLFIFWVKKNHKIYEKIYQKTALGIHKAIVFHHMLTPPPPPLLKHIHLIYTISNSLMVFLKLKVYILSNSMMTTTLIFNSIRWLCCVWWTIRTLPCSSCILCEEIPHCLTFPFQKQTFHIFMNHFINFQ